MKVVAWTWDAVTVWDARTYRRLCRIQTGRESPVCGTFSFANLYVGTASGRLAEFDFANL